MTITGGSTTPAGWYTDPGGSGHLRWWDGTAWSAHLAPQPTPAPTPVVALPPVAQAPVIQAPAAYEPAMSADNQPYVPFQGSWNGREQGGYSQGGAEDFARPAQWNTAGAWLLSFSYIFTLIIALVYVVLEFPALTLQTAQTRQGSITFASVLIQLALWLLMVLFALTDRRKLKSYGYIRPASVLWILLFPPLLYLIMRGVAISREVRHGFGPLIAYLVSIAAIVLLGVGSAIAIPAILAGQVAGSSVSGAAFASSLQTGLNEQGGNYTVICPRTIPTTVDSTFSCTATPSGSGKAHTLKIEVVRGADGQPTTKLLSVTPPFSG
ncbi:MAG: hypothetical protein QOH69_1135 [Actinomycetota bacterium]|jgi:hypothetical protein|nr:hypothetical protein [Actinomycetota bacterium]